LNFNITILYIIAQNIKKKLSNLSAKEICIKNNFFNTITIYNNFNFVKHQFKEQLNKKKMQYNIIITLQFRNIYVSIIKLQQNI